MAVCEAQGPYLSISILRIASTLIWVFKKFFNQDLREQRRDLFKLRNFDNSEDSASNFQWILGDEIEMFFFSISCFAQPVAAYCLYIPKHGLVKIWRNPDILRKQPWKGFNMYSRTVYFPLLRNFPGHLLCSWGRHSNISHSSVSISRLSRLSETITDSLNYFSSSYFTLIFMVNKELSWYWYLTWWGWRSKCTGPSGRGRRRMEWSCPASLCDKQAAPDWSKN